MMDVNFYPLDLQSWPRGQMFYYFTQMAPTGYSLTTQVDVTVMWNALKKHKLKFFPAYLWLVTKMLNRQIEFKVAMNDETLGYWETLTPLYATFHDDDQTISLMWTEFCESFSEFYEHYLENKKNFGSHHGILAQSQQMPPANSYTVSCLPWIAFEHFAVHSYENKPYYFPSIEAGKFTKEGDTITMPLSITAHHATTDGWHMKKFLEDLQHGMNEPHEWL